MMEAWLAKSELTKTADLQDNNCISHPTDVRDKEILNNTSSVKKTKIITKNLVLII